MTPKLPAPVVLRLVTGGLVFALLIVAARLVFAVAPMEAVPDVKAPCWLRRVVAPTGYGNNGQHELILGNLRGQLMPVGGAPVAFADPYFDMDDCGEGDLVATDLTSVPYKMPANAPFQIRLESAIAIDDGGTGTVAFSATIERRGGVIPSCTSTIIWSDAKTASVSFGPSPTYDFIELDPWGSGGLWFNLVSPPPGLSHYWSYWIEVTTTVPGVGTNTARKFGCYRVDALP